MKTGVVIVAAGKGLRLGGPVPKQYQRIGGQMILTRTLRALRACEAIGPIVVAIHPDAEPLYREALSALPDPRDISFAHGGAERSESVCLALEALAPHAPDRVLIHDGARPFVSPDALDRICAAEGGAILAEAVVDALWRETEAGFADTPVPRAGLWRAQTPQAFPFDAILAAHRAEAGTDGPPALDDAEVFRRAGHTVALIPGGPENFKITTAADMVRAERYLKTGATAMETRIGQGFDVHRFTDGDAVWLCGVKIPHSLMYVYTLPNPLQELEHQLCNLSMYSTSLYVLKT